MAWCRFYGNGIVSCHSSSIRTYYLHCGSIDRGHNDNALLFFGEIRVLCALDTKNRKKTWRSHEKLCIRKKSAFSNFERKSKVKFLKSNVTSEASYIYLYFLWKYVGFFFCSKGYTLKFGKDKSIFSFIFRKCLFGYTQR